MSDMRLRSIIRAPVRYGEAKPKEPAASASQRIYIIRDLSSSGGDEKLPASYRRQKSPVCPRTKPYDPNRPPVPWCTKPYPGQAEKEAWTEAYSVYRESLYPPVSSGVAKSSIECFVVSNVLTNNDEFEDERDGIGWARNPRMSSNRFTRPDSRVLLSDLKPSLQVEIFHNYVAQLDEHWYTAQEKLDITGDEYLKLVGYSQHYNKSIDVEDRTLHCYRKKQREVLQDPDAGEAKDPVENRLNRLEIFNYRKMNCQRHKFHDDEVMIANTTEVLEGYRFLDRLELPRSLAGTWSNGSETVFRGQHDHPTPEPEKWERMEDLSTRAEYFADFDECVLTHAESEPGNAFIQAIGNSSTTNPVAILAHEGQGTEGDTPFWFTDHTQGSHANVSDLQARYQWQLTQAGLEGEQTREGFGRA